LFLAARVLIVPLVLRHDNLLQWPALLSDLPLVLGRPPSDAGDPAWLKTIGRRLG